MNFVRKYPQLPTSAFKSIDEIKQIFSQDENIIFYYPTVPNKTRDMNTIALLQHFPNATMLMEKPSHNTAAEAKAFMAEIGSDEDRLYIGMHNSLHAGNKSLLAQCALHKEQIVGISAKFNYPKDPNDPGARRCYDKNTGGAMLDLGVYVFQAAKDILTILGQDLHKFDEKKRIWVKKTADNIDYEMEAELTYGGVDVYLESKINPGSNHCEEIVVTLKNGDRIVANQFAHWHDSCGVIIEHMDGTATTIAESKDSKTTYSCQVESVQNKQKPDFLTLSNSVYLLEFIDIVRSNATKTN